MQHIATVCFGQGADCCWDETVSRPKLTLKLRPESGSNGAVTCRLTIGNGQCPHASSAAPWLPYVCRADSTGGCKADTQYGVMPITPYEPYKPQYRLGSTNAGVQRSRRNRKRPNLKQDVGHPCKNKPIVCMLESVPIDSAQFPTCVRTNLVTRSAIQASCYLQVLARFLSASSAL